MTTYLRRSAWILATASGALALLAAGCGQAPSTPPAAPPASPPAPSGVTSSTGQALDTQAATGSVRATVDRDQGLLDLKEVATFYQIHQADGAQARDLVLKDIQRDHAKLYQAIQEGRYVLFSGDPSNAPAGASNTIVAYMRDTPTQGGVAAFLDGSARRATVQEFQAAAKLGQ